jgi:predicted sulfurtransferase
MPSQHCILFYKYHPLTSDPSTLDRYRLAQEKLCQALNLTGRILIGLSEEGEGINGTLAGEKCDLSVYVDCMMGRNFTEADETKKNASDAFRAESKFFFDCINRPELIFSSETDFKWSTRSTLSNVTTEDTSVNKEEDQAWFPDLNIKLVKEIISTGGAFSNITANETSVGYLTPREWHEEMKLLQQRQEIIKNNVDDSTVNEVVETVLIDVRNHKECQIGTFLPGVAIDPNTRTFSQFPKWVRDHSHPSVGGDEVQNGGDDIGGSISLDNKRILL